MSAILRVATLWLVVLLVACVDMERRVEVRDCEQRVWSEAEEFVYDNEDSVSRRDISITVRYDRDYRADMIPMRILTISPDSMVYEEPFTLHVPHLADLLPEEQTFVYRSNVLLARKGRYTFRLIPDTTIAGIASIGVIVDNTTATNR